MSALRSIYDWILRQAEKPYAEWALFLLALAEPCVSPVPPDVLLIPMSIASREKSFRFAVICLTAVIIGSLIGYGIGAVGMATIGHLIVDSSGYRHFHEAFHHWGIWIVIAKGLVPIIPIPLTFLVIACGVSHLNILLFMFAMVAAQGTRFFIIAWLIYRFGDPARHFIERHLTWVASGIVALVAIFVWVSTR
jgi:membrane protein YqaA with SNARE-associated domain